ncbi:MAG TPA: alr0857 family protein [Thermosynechococcaceae cyanobacterium]
MLKLNYTESDLHMERIAAPLEVMVAQRVLLALRAGQTLHIQPGHASFLIPAHAPCLAQLEALQLEQQVSLTPVDEQFMEICVEGSWIAATAQAHEGTFIAALGDRVEFLVYKLWQATQPQASFLA